MPKVAVLIERSLLNALEGWAEKDGSSDPSLIAVGYHELARIVLDGMTMPEGYHYPELPR